MGIAQTIRKEKMVNLGTDSPPKFKPNPGEIGAGTHRGRLDAEARQRRAVKNVRNRSRQHPTHPLHHHDMIQPGSNKKINTRLNTEGNRERRGRI